VNDQQQRQIDRDLEYIRERCRANAEIAREDPDQRRRTVSVQMRTAAQNGKTVEEYERAAQSPVPVHGAYQDREQDESADWFGALGAI
jgi:hypothetical protein